MFPGHERFIAAGRYELYMAVKKHGGVEHWRNRLGLPASIRTSWTDDELHAELAAFIGDRLVWPPRADFKAAGKQGLVVAVQRRGGVGVWAQRLGKDLSPRQRANVSR